MTQEFVTLPREVVEQALEAMTAAMGAGPYKHRCSDAAEALRAAFEQPQNHVPDAGNMVQSGWNLVPVEPTEEMLRAGCGSESPAMFRESLRRETDDQKTVEMVEKIIQRNLNSYRAMLAAAPQPQTTEQSSAVQQPQGEQEPVAWLKTWNSVGHARTGMQRVDLTPECETWLANMFPTITPLYTHPLPKRELTKEEARRIYNEATYHASIAVFMTRMDAEHQDADDKGVSGWLQEAEDRVKHRTIDAAHEIGQAAAPQQDEQEPVAHPDDAAIDRFAAAMKAKMAKQRSKGYGGWEDKADCPASRLQQMLVDHIAKGDPVDVANFTMMLWSRGEHTEQPQDEQEPVATLHCTEECYVYARATDAGKRIRFEQPIDLYTHPQPKREPLTHYEIHELFRRSLDDCQDGDEIKAFARAIEAAHGIK